MLNQIRLSSRLLRPPITIPPPYLSIQQNRTYAKSPGANPLELLRATSEKRGLCDVDGIRKQDVHWTFGISTSGATLDSVRLF